MAELLEGVESLVGDEPPVGVEPGTLLGEAAGKRGVVAAGPTRLQPERTSTSIINRQIPLADCLRNIMPSILNG